MIYLIDDNRREQQQEYNCSFLALGEYQERIKPIYKITTSEEIAFLKDATAIFIHQSFPDFNAIGATITGQTIVYDKISNLFRGDPEIPYVIFSNGITDHTYDSENPFQIEQINKRQFYLNLKDFLDYYIAKDVIEFKILAYGKNFIAMEIAELFERIAGLFHRGEHSESAAITALNAEIILLIGADPEINKKLTEALKNAELVPLYLSYIEKILQSFIRYGRNIYYQ